MKRLSKGQLNELIHEIDHAGELQHRRHMVHIEYEAQRDKVIVLLERYEAKEEEIVKAKHYEAVLCHDSQRFIDVNEFIKQVKDKLLRALCLRVILKNADVVLGHANPAVLFKLIKKRDRPEKTLHIEPRKR
jgi:hypothetical protein